MNSIPVIRTADTVETAYSMGYNAFDDVPSDEADSEGYHHFKESARWANTLAPRLKALAGYEADGPMRRVRDVALVDPADEDDEPIEADVVLSSYVYDELVSAFDEGARDALEGEPATAAEVTL